MKNYQFIALCASPFLLLGGVAAAGIYDGQQGVTKTYRVGHMFGGGMGVIEKSEGKWGIYSQSETIGLYSYGEPRVVAFGCDGKPGAVIIAMEESDLPACERVEPIQYEKKADWAN
jgi:hypothetical protein